ncbi:lipopolysaccharide biosynthesis protein [Weissella oryzae SG25]|uniref:Lipopolysaccharide biosynthesis protein n=2 Tax=Weissella TaxID=46255 RepID=A0A069CWE0_WEIOS|nr:lipopolysaccharide biosynthesis protein [Weissella oryzae SG25]
MNAMNYFVNENIFTLNSGTEFSAAQRLALFHENGLSAKILTRNYNPSLISDLTRLGLTQADVINMYDYFQEVVELPETDVPVRFTDTIDKQLYHIEGVNANETLVKHAGRTIAKVAIAPGTVGIMGAVDYLNDMNATVAKDIWDRRGFRSSTQYFHYDGQAGTQIFFNANGIPKLQITHMNINGTLYPTMYKLLDYKGRAYRFDNEEQLLTFFMSELASQQQTVFINDRPSLLPALAGVKNAFGKWQYLHNIHAGNGQTIGGSRKFEEYLKPLFTQYNKAIDGVIVATEEQKAEIQKYFDFNQVVALPDTFTKAVPLAKAPRGHKVVHLGRIAAEHIFYVHKRLYINVCSLWITRFVQKGLTKGLIETHRASYRIILMSPK